MDEFALIRRYFDLPASRADVALGIGDDCALLRPRPGCELALTTDTLVAGRHFPLATAPEDIGWKALAVNLSDLAAMGAEPQAFLLALSLTEADETWLAGFSKGLHEMAREAGIVLVGGDTTRGPLSITITAIGSVPAGAALRRSGAKPGDLVCVTGTLGDAALALVRLSSGSQLSDAGCDAAADGRTLRLRLDRPTPRLAAGQVLRNLAHAAIDLSDGLAGDLAHILEASGVGAEIAIGDLPMSAAFARLHPPAERLRLQAAGGDDYELCVCIPAEHLRAAQDALDVALTPIGRISITPGLFWVESSGCRREFEARGYDHFPEQPPVP